jgi:hypothetical protein
VVSGILTGLVRVRVTVIYTVALTVVTAVLLVLGPDAQSLVIRHASTNLHNLSRGHVATLLDSAFVVDAGPIFIWLPGLVCLLALFEMLFRSVRLIVAFAIGHIGATLLPRSVSRADDVGMSYGAMGVLGALSAAIPSQRRAVWVAWWAGVAVTAVVVERDFTAVGHAFAFGLGLLVGTRFGPAGDWTPVRRVLLGVAVAFGFLALGDTVPAMILTAASGGLCAVTVAWITRRNSLAHSSIQSERHVSRTGSASSSAGIGHP